MILLCAATTLAQSTFTMKGHFPSQYNGKKAYVVDLDTREKLDSLTITNDNIDFTTKVTASRAAALMVDNRRVVNFILEPGEATIDEYGKVTGTALNDLNEGINDRLNALYTDYKMKQGEIMKAEMTNEEKMAAVEKLADVISAREDSLLNVNYQANKNNPVGYVMFTQIADGKSSAELESLLADASDQLKHSRAAETFRTVAANLEKTAEGKMFSDFSVKTSNGKTVKLSDYVGKGDYVLVDFFASWCGPCRREMPTLKRIYGKHDGKGLKVIGLAVWDDPVETQKCVEDLGLPWTIVDNCGNTPTDVYGVRGIPHIIIFGPDGMIVSRGLRGEALAAKIDTLLAK